LRTVSDQIGRTIRIPDEPKRIVSLVPSQTELLFDLGLDDEVVGLTKFCIHPEEKWRTTQRVGGTKSVKHEAIKALAPDLIIANKEENTKEDVEALASEYPVWVSDVRTIENALEMIDQVGVLVNRRNEAGRMIEKLRSDFAALRGIAAGKRVVYLIWNNPIMVAGQDTFIDAVLSWCGAENLAQKVSGRYPEITASEIAAWKPDAVLLSSEPFPFKEKHLKALDEQINGVAGTAKIELVDGELFSWYGSRLLKSAAYLRQLFK
jgi:ABC-type Fe3+-hydroxamate transport system substrate-binding protein